MGCFQIRDHFCNVSLISVACKLEKFPGVLHGIVPSISYFEMILTEFFYGICTHADDFDDFCSRSSELGEKSNGAPLFTVTDSLGASSSNRFDDTFNLEHYSECSGHAGEDEWQLL